MILKTDDFKSGDTVVSSYGELCTVINVVGNQVWYESKGRPVWSLKDRMAQRAVEWNKKQPQPAADEPKQTDGGMKYDSGKPRMDLLLSGCPQALEQVAAILTFGAEKYAAHSWQTVPDGENRYLAALLRHLTAHAKGEKQDAESGMSHLAHAACNALFILELEARKCTSVTEKVDA